MCRLYLDGDVQESRRMQLKLLEIMEALFWDVNPIPVKAPLGLMEYAGTICAFRFHPWSRNRERDWQRL